MVLLSLPFVAAASSPSSAQPVASPTAHLARSTVGAVESLGELRIPAGGTVLGTPLGGLSGITYDAENGVYYALSDDRGSRAPARFYRLTIDLADGRLDTGGVDFTGVVTLTDAAGRIFDAGAIDPEGIVLSPSGTLFVSSEGDASARPPVAPFVAEFGTDGRQIAALPVPAYYVPDGSGAVGVRNNLAFEPLAISGDGALVLSGTENALAQDGPAATLAAGSPSRLLGWRLADRQLAFEQVYPVSPIPVPPNPATGGADNGLVELAALDETGTLLSMERSYAAGVGNTVRLFETELGGATDVAGIPALRPPGGEPVPFTAMRKRQIADIGALGLRPDNLEGMTLGPRLPDGRRLLILVSDDNFNPQQVTQFIALALTVVEVPGRAPIYLPLAILGPIPRLVRLMP